MKKKIFIKTSVWVALIFTFLCSMLNVGIVSSATHFYAPSEPEYGNYFNSDFETREEVLEFNRNLNEEIEGEGLVLLKNDGSLPIGGDLRVSVFGKTSVNVMSGGSGSGAGGGVPVTGFIEALQQEGFTVNPTLVNFYKDNSKSGSGRGSAPGNGNVSPGYNTGETPVANYTSDIEETYESYGDAAIVVFSRISGEGFDLPRTMMWNGSTYKGWGTDVNQAVPGARDKYDHYLQLDQNEADLLKYLGDRFDNVIVLLNTGSQFEVGFLDDPGHYGYHKNVKGCIWMGYPGSSGNVAVAKALKGEINPSGRTVDTWARDFKNDPVWQNHANNMMEGDSSLKGNQYANNPQGGGNGGGGYISNYVIYKEGIYMGYRYYETRGFTEGNGAYSSAGKGKADVVYNQVTGKYISLSNDKDGDNEIHGTYTTDWDNWYDASVVYPFGYGLSYTTFDWEIVSANPENGAKLTADGTISIDVKVTNTGDYAGKDVVELYFTAPYYTGGIEKAHVVLGGFAKTDLIQPGESDTVTVEMTVRDMSSYDWNDANENGFKGYELDAGTYEIKLMKDSHTVVHTIDYTLEEGIKYATSETTGYPIENRFDEVSNYLLEDQYAQDGVGYMTRADFAGTFPVMAYKITESQWIIEAVSMWHNGAVDTPDKPWYTDVMPTTGADNGIMLQDLVGVEYTDPLWDKYMDQFTVSQLQSIAMGGSYASGQNYPELGVTRVPNASGPAAWLYGAPSGTYSTWCCETVLASTWNTELARAKGIGMGNEALWGNGSSGSKIPFWYAPAVNIHRSPFSGRNFEYYSEDGLLTGILSAAMIDGAQSKGLICYVKHFGVNDQEANRCGLLTWLNEQSMREIYIKPWEVCVKDANTMGIMTSLNKIGPCWAGGSYGLLTEILHNEWGFNGNIVTDSYSSSWSNGDMMIRAGANLALGSGGLKSGTSSATAVTALRNAAQGILYSHANSMAMNTGTTPTKPRVITSFEATDILTVPAFFKYSGSVATAVVNTEIYPDVCVDDVVYTLNEGSELPAGLVLNSDGSITGRTTEEVSLASFTVIASLLDDEREETFRISVVNTVGSIVYSPVSLSNACVNKEYVASVADASIIKPNATQADIDKLPKITYSIADGCALPDGLTLSADGTISGIAKMECENYVFAVVASAIGYKDVTATYKISVYNSITFDACEIENAKFGENYFVSIATADCVNKVTYRLKSDSKLPYGLTLTEEGYIVGKPWVTVTDSEFTVIASAPYAEESEATFKISVGMAFAKDTSLSDGKEGEEYFAKILAIGSSGIRYRLEEGSELPEGLRLSKSGEISGIPTESGIYHITVVAEAPGKIDGKIDLTLYIAPTEAQMTWWQMILLFLARLFGLK